MINHIATRSVTGFLFGLIGYLVVPFSRHTFHLTHNQMMLSIGISLFLAICGLLYGYKSFLNPAEQLDGFIIRSLSAVWFGILANFIALLITDPSPPSGPTTRTIIIASTLVVLFVLFAILYGYKLFLQPVVTYISSFPTLSTRMIALSYFGILGFFNISYHFTKNFRPGCTFNNDPSQLPWIHPRLSYLIITRLNHECC